MCLPLSALSTSCCLVGAVTMRLLWLYLFLQAVTALADFGTSYFGHSRVCQKWSCLNRSLNFTDQLPTKNEYLDLLKALVPSGDWHQVVETAVDACFNSSKSNNKYTSTCPGQSLMHCVVDHFVQNCPERDRNKFDACAPVSTLAGFNYMFSQSRYENLEKNLPVDRRPAWFLRNYFRSACCDIPHMFSDSLLSDCGFNKFMHYHIHGTQSVSPFARDEPRIQDVTTPNTHDVTGKGYNFLMPQDPADCCEMNEFIQPSWRSECDFKLQWDTSKRLTVLNNNELITTTEKISLKHSDVKLVPTSCEKQQCIFGKLNVISDTGVVDKDAFGKLLDNMTKLHPIWTKAKARVVTQCLSRPLLGYDGNCEINKILACTFDILSENCPYSLVDDPCVHRNTTTKEGVICQISSSKYRPRHRRQYCGFPNFVDREVLSECQETSISRLDYVPEAKPKPRSWGSPVNCKVLTQSTSCLLEKMGSLNKYGFMDYFKMKDKIRTYSDGLTSNLYELYNSALQDSPLYTDHCTSPKKLNVLDSMIMTCPISKRKTNEQCNRIFSVFRDTIPNNVTRGKLDQMIEHYKNVYFPAPTEPSKNGPVLKTIPHKSIVKENVLYDFGILNSNNAPPVVTIDLKPKDKTLVLLPVYQRSPKDPLAINSLHNDGVLRS